MQRLVDSAAPGVGKEEALWAAGEASLQLTHAPERGYGGPYAGWSNYRRPPEPAPQYYEQLIAQFPSSELLPYAQWRWAEAVRCQGIYRSGEQSALSPDLAEAIAAYGKVAAPEPSYPWAWAQLRTGLVCYRAADYARALQSFRAVAERMDGGAEKALGTMATADCLARLGRGRESARWYRIALGMPDVCWGDVNVSPYFAWGPPKQYGIVYGTTKSNASRALERFKSAEP